MRQCGIGDSTSADNSVQNLDALAENLPHQNGAAVPMRAAICVVLEPRAAAISITRCGMIIIGEQAATGSIELALLNVKQAA